MRVMLLTAATAVALSALSAQPATPTRLAVVEGFAIPESARYDAERDQYFVSNVNAHATASDNNGFISLLGADGTLVERQFIAGGQERRHPARAQGHGDRRPRPGRDRRHRAPPLRSHHRQARRRRRPRPSRRALPQRRHRRARRHALRLGHEPRLPAHRQPHAGQDRSRVSRLASRARCPSRWPTRGSKGPTASSGTRAPTTCSSPRSWASTSTAGPAAMACTSSPPAPAATTAWSASTTRRSSSPARICRD